MGVHEGVGVLEGCVGVAPVGAVHARVAAPPHARAHHAHAQQRRQLQENQLSELHVRSVCKNVIQYSSHVILVLMKPIQQKLRNNKSSFNTSFYKPTSSNMLYTRPVTAPRAVNTLLPAPY